MMKTLARNVAVCGVMAALVSVGMSMLFTWAFARYISFERPLPFLIACERLNTSALGIWLFVIVFALGTIRVVLRELRRRAFEDLKR